MKKVLLGSVATGALVAAAGATASAADLGARPAYKAPPPAIAPVPAFSWTGCFVGAHGGWGWGKKDVNMIGLCSGTHLVSNSAGIDTSGAIFGGQIGCDYQFAGNFVLGIQGDLAGARLTGSALGGADSEHSISTEAGVHVKTDWLASVTGRVGVTGWIPSSLLYVKGGGAWIRETWSVRVPDFGVIQETSQSQTRSGWTIGGGIEYAIAPNWSVFAEFDHYDFGTKNVFDAKNTSGPGSVHYAAKQRVEAVKLGVNYRFNFGKAAPVAARY